MPQITDNLVDKKASVVEIQTWGIFVIGTVL